MADCMNLFFIVCRLISYVINEVEEHRSCIGQGVYAVEYSTMTGDAISHVFDAFITFDGRDDYISRKSGNGNEGADQNYVGRGERSEESQKVSYNRSADIGMV